MFFRSLPELQEKMQNVMQQSCWKSSFYSAKVVVLIRLVTSACYLKNTVMKRHFQMCFDCILKEDVVFML